VLELILSDILPADRTDLLPDQPFREAVLAKSMPTKSHLTSNDEVQTNGTGHLLHILHFLEDNLFFLFQLLLL